MYVAETTEFAVDIKQPVAQLFERVYAAILQAEPGEPAVQFLFSDRAGSKTSSVQRAVARIPALAEFESILKGARILSNRAGSGAVGLQANSANVREVLAGVPRSFSFDEIMIAIRVIGLGPALGTPVGGPAITIAYSGSGGLGGRSISVRALRVVAADASDKQLPPVSQSIAALLAACGEVKVTRQRVFDVGPESPTSPDLVARFAGPSVQAAAAIRQLVDEYRANLSDIIGRAGLPHELSAPGAAGASVSALRSGPMKRELTLAFAPLGYDCRAMSGAYQLRRRTSGNLVIEVYLDVGTWSRSLSGFFTIQGLGFTERLPLPASPSAWGGVQYPIDSQTGWRRLVENLAAVVTEYDRSLTPAIEDICDPIPDWYRPEG